MTKTTRRRQNNKRQTPEREESTSFHAAHSEAAVSERPNKRSKTSHEPSSSETHDNQGNIDAKPSISESQGLPSHPSHDPTGSEPSAMAAVPSDTTPAVSQSQAPIVWAPPTLSTLPTPVASSLQLPQGTNMTRRSAVGSLQSQGSSRRQVLSQNLADPVPSPVVARPPTARLMATPATYSIQPPRSVATPSAQATAAKKPATAHAMGMTAVQRKTAAKPQNTTRKASAKPLPAKPSVTASVARARQASISKNYQNNSPSLQSNGFKKAGRIALKLVACVVGMAIWSLAAYCILSRFYPTNSILESDEEFTYPIVPCFANTASSSDSFDFVPCCVKAAAMGELLPCPVNGECQRGELQSCGPSDFQHVLVARAGQCVLTRSAQSTVERIRKVLARVNTRRLCAAPWSSRAQGHSTGRAADLYVFEYHKLMDRAFYSATEPIDWDGIAKWLDYAVTHDYVEGLALHWDADDTLWIGLTPQFTESLSLPFKCQAKRRAAATWQKLSLIGERAITLAGELGTIAWNELFWTNVVFVTFEIVMSYLLWKSLKDRRVALEKQ